MMDFIATHSETLIGMIGGLMITLLLLLIQWLLKEAGIRSALKPLIGTYTVYLKSGELKEGSNGEVESIKIKKRKGKQLLFSGMVQINKDGQTVLREIEGQISFMDAGFVIGKAVYRHLANDADTVFRSGTFDMAVTKSEKDEIEIFALRRYFQYEREEMVAKQFVWRKK